MCRFADEQALTLFEAVLRGGQRPSSSTVLWALILSVLSAVPELQRYCRALVQQGGATWGASREEALANLDEVIRMVVASMIERGQPVPEEAADRRRSFRVGQEVRHSPSGL